MKSYIKLELIKTKRTSARYLYIILSGIIPITLLFQSSALEITKFDQFQNQAFNIIALFFMPLYVIFLCASIPHIEHRTNSWKQILASPQTLFHLYFAKFIVIQIFILLFILSLDAWIGVVTLFLHFGETFQYHERDLIKLLYSNIEIYFAILPISAFQLWLSMRFQNLILPIIIGVSLLAITALEGMHEYFYAEYIPFFYSILIAFTNTNFTTIFIGSIFYSALFLLIGYKDFSKTCRKFYI